MKRFIFTFIAYLTTGIGLYHTFLGTFKLYGLMILILGLLGVSYDMFNKKSQTKTE